MSLRNRIKVLIAALLALGGASVSLPVQPAEAGPPAGTCGAREGCGCGGVYVLKYKYILVHC